MKKCYNYTEDCDNSNICPCFRYEEDSNLIYGEKDIIKNKIGICYKYLDFIENFIERYDEEHIGDFPMFSGLEYDEALATLRGCLHVIIKEER